MYLATDEYALAKARQENILLTTNKKNWTIIRPYKTYNNNRLQLGMYEKEEWLYRLMMGKTLVFPNELKKRKTTLTYAADVAVAISELIENESAYGEIFILQRQNRCLGKMHLKSTHQFLVKLQENSFISSMLMI